MINKYTTVIRFVCLSFVVFCFGLNGLLAQTQPNKKTKKKVEDAVNGDFEIVRPYKPVLVDASKLRVDPDSLPPQRYEMKNQYILSNKKLDTKPTVGELPKLIYKSSVQTYTTYGNMLRLGSGSNNTSIADVYLNSNNIKGDFALGFQGNGEMRTKSEQFPEYMNINSALFSNYVTNKVEIHSSVNYTHRNNGYWSADTVNKIPNKSFLSKSEYGLVEGKLLLNNPLKVQDDFLQYKFDMDVYSLKGKNSSSMDEFGLHAGVNFSQPNQKKLRLSIKAGYDYVSTFLPNTSSKYKQEFSTVRIMPQLVVVLGTLSIKAGVNMVDYSYTSQTSTSFEKEFKAYPALDVELPIADKDAKLFVNVHGNTVVNRYRNSIQQNPYIQQTNAFYRSAEKIDILFGGLGTLFPNVSLGLSANYKLVEDMQTFILRDVSPGVIAPTIETYYIKGNTQLFAMSAELHGDFSKRVNFQTKFISYSYATPIGEEASCMPFFTSVSAVKFRLWKKVQLELTANIIGTSRGVIKSNDGTQKSTSNEAFANLGGVLDYTPFKSLSLFVKANNLLDQKYNQYMVYPYYLRTILGGLSYVF